MKEAFLRERGWYQWYNPDYWCHAQFDAPGRDATNWGLSTEDAYQFETEPETKEKILQGMDFRRMAERTLSNMAFQKKEPGQ